MRKPEEGTTDRLPAERRLDVGGWDGGGRLGVVYRGREERLAVVNWGRGGGAGVLSSLESESESITTGLREVPGARERLLVVSGAVSTVGSR